MYLHIKHLCPNLAVLCSYVAKCVSMYISRTPQFFNFTVPPLKIIGVRFRSIRPKIMSVLDEIAKKFGFEKLTGFLNYKPDLI
jgi:hypothetical protein